VSAPICVPERKVTSVRSASTGVSDVGNIGEGTHQSSPQGRVLGLAWGLAWALGLGWGSWVWARVMPGGDAQEALNATTSSIQLDAARAIQRATDEEGRAPSGYRPSITGSADTSYQFADDARRAERGARHNGYGKQPARVPDRRGAPVSGASAPRMRCRRRRRRCGPAGKRCAPRKAPVLLDAVTPTWTWWSSGGPARSSATSRRALPRQSCSHAGPLWLVGASDRTVGSRRPVRIGPRLAAPERPCRP